MRLKRVGISGVLLTNMFEDGLEIHAKIIKGLPKGTQFMYSIPSANYGIEIVVQHESFDDLKDGDLIPEHEKIIVKKLAYDEY